MTKRSRSPPPSAAARDGNGKTAAKNWVGWEEEVVLDDSGRRVVCYYLRCAPPRGGDGVVERDLAVVGKYWGVGNMAYTAHPKFLRSIEAAAIRSPGPSRAVTVAVEATQLRWKSRREVMDWLTSLVADSPYRTSASADTSDGCSVGDHDGGSTASKDALSVFAGNNPKGFAWLCPLPHLDKWRKHYRSFCRDGMRISVHDFIYIKSEEGRECNVGYVEDMYEDGAANNMVVVRWMDKPDDDHGAVLPPDVHEREVFFSYGLQDIGVNCVGGLAPVLNYQHFRMFQRREEEHNKWKPYLCQRQIVGETFHPFNVAQLQGYANQEIVRELSRAPSSMAMVVHSKEPNKDKTDGGQKRKRGEISEHQLVKNPAAPGNVTSDRAIDSHTALVAIDTVQKLPQCNATNVQSVAKDAPGNVAIKDQAVKKLPECNATNNGQTAAKGAPENVVLINDQTVQKLLPCSATNDQTVQRLLPQNVTSEQTGGNSAPVSAPKSKTVVNKPPLSVANAQAVLKSASGSGSLGSVLKPNVEELFNVGSRVEALSQDSGIRGCWFRCMIVKKKRRGDHIKVKYQDIRNPEGTGHLKEWLRVERTARPDRLGIRLTGRPLIRPWPSNLPNIPSPSTPGTIVDVRLQDGWWEGIVVEPRTVGRVTVYFPGEKRIGEFVVGDLRRSFEWVGDKWMALMIRKDVVTRLPAADTLANQERPKNEKQKSGSLLSSIVAARNAKAAGAKTNAAPVPKVSKGEQSAAPVPPTVILEPMQVNGISSKPGAQNISQQSGLKAQGVSAQPAAPRPGLQSRGKVEDEPARPAAEKVSPQRREGDGTSPAGAVPPDVRRARVDLGNLLKSDKVLKWAERKARGSGHLMGYSDGSSSQDSAPNGDTAPPVNSVPVITEECKTNEQAAITTTPPMMID
uniref:Uncharacterized protein n=2 Tax=Avena sativa TaxID=4498 RepID=A0ACD5Y9M9_AVESA